MMSQLLACYPVLRTNLSHLQVLENDVTIFSMRSSLTDKHLQVLETTQVKVTVNHWQSHTLATGLLIY